MSETDGLQEEIEKLKRERDAYAEALKTSNDAFMEKVSEFSIIKRMAGAVNVHQGMERVCSDIVDLLIDETTAENCSLWLMNKAHSHIILAAVRGQNNAAPKYFPPNSPNPITMEVGHGAAGWVAANGKSLLIENVEDSPYFVPFESGKSGGIKSLLCLPILDGPGVLGVLNLSHPDIGAFSRENERLLGLITDQAAIILSNHKLFEEVQNLNKHLEQKVEERTRNLVRSEERYSRAITAGKVGIWDWDVQRDCLYLADNLYDMLGEPREGREPAPAKTWLRRIHPSDRRSFLQKTAQLLRGELPVLETEIRMRGRNGGLSWFLIRCAMVRDENHQPVSLSGSNTDITRRKQAELELANAQAEALVHAHVGAKAEFANTVLHNVGNLLNSLNVNGVEIRETIQRLRFGNLVMGFQMLTENSHRVAEFLASDTKGIQLTQYFGKMGKLAANELNGLISLAGDINNKISLMRDIIETQQSHAKDNDRDPRDLAQLVDEALKIQQELIRRESVRVKRAYEALPPLVIPSAKLIHVLINLIKNGVEAMNQTPVDRRELSLKIGLDAGGRPTLVLSDTGSGIAPEDLPKMFSHGFTTKKNGHGFGLHYCAKAMTEMGGRITVTSEGRGQGATFTMRFASPEGGGQVSS